MDCHTLIKNEEIMETIVEMSSEWLLVFDENDTLVSLTIPSEEQGTINSKTFFTLFHEHEADRFHVFLRKLSEGKKASSDYFEMTVNNRVQLMHFEGMALSEGVLLKGKKVKEEAGDLIDVLKHIPIPSFTIDVEGRVRSCNHLFTDVLKTLDEPLNTDEPYLNDDYSFHRTISKLADIVNMENRKAAVVFEKEEIRLTIYGHLLSPTLLSVYIKDETVEHRFEQLLTYKQQMESVSQIAAGVAHELRNPLSVIKGFIQLSKLSNSLNKYYETISSEIDRMNLIIEDFLSMSRKKIDKKYVLPSDLMESMLMIFRSECLLHDIDFHFSIRNSRRYLYVNDQMIRQVLLNVLRNSIEAYEKEDKDCKFTMLTSTYGDTYSIELQDYGPGMPPDVLEEIYKPFFTTKDKGTGIGIPLCKRIIEEHKGTLDIESEPGEGTKVIITLPLYVEMEP
ncbi:two-component sensor histidine kinase [Bacillus sp. H-16]|uniref:two-component system sensor histidine kinase NtrB n=1 Tax=Alteribacter salitolerans TaxID=2912333 RepID=UPI00196280F0|nr:ATP-binding protein [Alteribacter salitolerans]MBM7097079.1 two-component sensor histidine kinase [Alteribacter salitolerans]